VKGGVTSVLLPNASKIRKDKLESHEPYRYLVISALRVQSRASRWLNAVNNPYLNGPSEGFPILKSQTPSVWCLPCAVGCRQGSERPSPSSTEANNEGAFIKWSRILNKVGFMKYGMPKNTTSGVALYRILIVIDQKDSFMEDTHISTP
jgi:hypothetical protein